MTFQKIFLLFWIISIIISGLIIITITLILKYQVKKEKSIDLKAKTINYFSDPVVLLILLTPIANLYSSIRLASRFGKIKKQYIDDVERR